MSVAQHLRTRKIPALSKMLVPFLVPAILVALWAVAAKYQWMAEQVLPAPALVWETALELLAGPLWRNLWASLQHLGLGLVIGIALGVILGGAMGASRRIEVVLYPSFLAVVQIPTLAWIPLLIMLLGLGEALKIAVIVKAVMTPVAIHAHVGMRDVDPRLVEAARTLRLSAWWRLSVLILPAAMPSFMTGLRLGLAHGWMSLVAVELLASAEGLGFLMVWGRQLFRLDMVFVCIVAIACIGLMMDSCFHGIGRWVLRWPQPVVATRSGWLGGDGLWSLALPLTVLSQWYVVSSLGWLDGNLIPSPAVAVASLKSGLSDGTLTVALGLSLKRSLLGLLLGAGAGLAAGLALGLFRPCDRLFGGTLTALRLVAIFAWLPLLTAWTGQGEAAMVAFIAFACFFPMQVSAQQGIASLSPQLMEAAQALRLGPFVRLCSLVLPGAAPLIFAGLRMAMVQAWIASVGAEYFMASSGGVGSAMMAAQQLFRMDVVLGCMVLIGLVGAFVGWLGRIAELHATRWRNV